MARREANTAVKTLFYNYTCKLSYRSPCPERAIKILMIAIVIAMWLCDKDHTQHIITLLGMCLKCGMDWKTDSQMDWKLLYHA